MWLVFLVISFAAAHVQEGKKRQLVSDVDNIGDPQEMEDETSRVEITGGGTIVNGRGLLNVMVKIGPGLGGGSFRKKPRGRGRGKGRGRGRGGRRPPGMGPGGGGGEEGPGEGLGQRPGGGGGIGGGAGGRPAGGRAGGRPAGGRPAGGRPAGGRPAGGRPAGGRPAGGRPAGGRPAGGRPAGGGAAGGAGGAGGGGGAEGGEFTAEEELGLASHNEFRQVHAAPAMTLNRKMCDEAKAYAEHLAATGKFEHSTDREDEGENLAYGCHSDESQLQTMDEAVKAWYDEVCDYSFETSSSTGGVTGHFTQVVWKASSELGIGRGLGEKKGMKCAYTVGRYKIAGNMGGEYEENVLKGNFDRASYCSKINREKRKFLDEKGNVVMVTAPISMFGVGEPETRHPFPYPIHSNGTGPMQSNGTGLLVKQVVDEIETLKKATITKKKKL